MRRKAEFLLAIDVGNTSTSYGLFKNGRLLRNFFCESNIIPEIRRFCVRSGEDGKNLKVMVSSVNPFRLSEVRKWVGRWVRKENVLLIGWNIKPQIRHKYRSINRLGHDRLVNLYGACKWYRKPLLLINFGTATTVDFISGKGVFEGGLIIPGIKTSFEALQEKAALLPLIQQIKRTSSFLGRDPKSCMVSGLLQGFGAMVDGLIARFRARYGSGLKVVASGGLAGLIKPYIESEIKVDQDHTLKSLALIYKEYRAKDNLKKR